MASTNQSPFYQKAESKFLSAQTDEERLMYLEEMIKECPKHKSSEKMLANLKTRRIKLKGKIEAEKKVKKSSGKIGIKKEDLQAVIIGKVKSGKSSLLSVLTNAKPEISEYELSTRTPIIGMGDYNGVAIQMIEVPAIDSEYYDRGVVNSADSILILVTNLNEISEIENQLERAMGKKIIVFNKIDLLSENEKRKISSTLQSRKYNFVMISTKTKEGIAEMKEKLFQSFGKIRVYTKEPGKIKSNRPIILPPNNTVKNVAEKILKGFASKIKETRVWGPSSKYPGQVVGLAHVVKDMDVVEFRTR